MFIVNFVTKRQLMQVDIFLYFVENAVDKVEDFLIFQDFHFIMIIEKNN